MVYLWAIIVWEAAVCITQAREIKPGTSLWCTCNTCATLNSSRLGIEFRCQRAGGMKLLLISTSFHFISLPWLTPQNNTKSGFKKRWRYRLGYGQRGRAHGSDSSDIGDFKKLHTHNYNSELEAVEGPGIAMDLLTVHLERGISLQLSCGATAVIHRGNLWIMVAQSTDGPLSS